MSHQTTISELENRILDLEQFTKALELMDPHHQNENSSIVYTLSQHIDRLRASFETHAQAQMAVPQ